MSELNGRTAIVTGAAQGLGLAIATRLWREGAAIVMADIQGEKVAAACRGLGDGEKTLAIATDTTASPSVRAMVDAAIARFGRLDVLVNVAGGSGEQSIDGIEDMPDEVWDGIIARNLRSTLLCAKAAIPHLRKSGAGRILNFSSGAVEGVTGKSTISAPLAYAAAKAAIHGLTNQLAKDLARDGIAVNVMQPGFVLTEPGARVRTLFERLSEAERQEMLSRTAPRQPEEVGWAVAYLMSDRAKELTGSVVRLSGRIIDLALRLVPAGEGPLGRVVRLEPLPSDAGRA